MDRFGTRAPNTAAILVLVWTGCDGVGRGCVARQESLAIARALTSGWHSRKGRVCNLSGIEHGVRVESYRGQRSSVPVAPIAHRQAELSCSLGWSVAFDRFRIMAGSGRAA